VGGCALSGWRKVRIVEKASLITGITGQDGSYLANFFSPRATKFSDSCGEAARSGSSEFIIYKIRSSCCRAICSTKIR